MIFDCQNIQKSYGIKEVLKDVSFHIEEQERCALVGINGAGKSTLLKIITGSEKADAGVCVLNKGKTLGYLAQEHEHTFHKTVYEELRSVKQPIFDLEAAMRKTEQEMKHASGEELESLMKTYTRLEHEFTAADGYAAESEIRGVLYGLGFTDELAETEVDTLSGGQKTRVALGRLLLQKPDLILLDEPTNHLDMQSIEWLENYLRTIKSAILLVSHDRYFLNRIVNKVVEIEFGVSRTYMGTYTDFAQKKEALRAAQIKAYNNQQAEIAHQEEVIKKLKSFNREKSIKRAESREKQLSHIERIEKPQELNDAMRITLTPSVESGQDVLMIEDLAKAYGEKQLFSGLSFELHRGDRVALIGDNGTGKTTILKIINKMVSKDAGRIRLGSKVHIGYYDQEHQVLSPNKTIFEEISDAYPELDNTKIRSTLAAFLFTGEDVFKPIHTLSGGERGRVSLAKLMLGNANLLILDEPTNHLDVTSKEILEQALNQYTGTLLYVSHDRFFINRTATRILELKDCALTEYLGNYDDYLERKAVLAENDSSGNTENAVKVEPIVSEAKADWKSMKEEQARKRKLENDIKKIEEKIENLEKRIAEIDEELIKPEVATNSARCMELSTEREEAETALAELLEKWEKLSS